MMIRLKIESSFLYVYFIILSQKSYHRIYKSCKNSERQFTVNFIRIRSKENILPYILLKFANAIENINPILYDKILLLKKIR